MKTDMTLLEKDGTPTIAELKAFFRDHDFSTQVSKYDPMTAPEEQNHMYIKAKKHFLSAWNKQMKLLTGKGSLINFTSNAPVRCLEEANENLVAGTVMEILTDETLCERIIDSMLTTLEGDITAELEKYATVAERNQGYASDTYDGGRAEAKNGQRRQNNRSTSTLDMLDALLQIPQIETKGKDGQPKLSVQLQDTALRKISL